MKVIGLNVRAVREAAGVTQEELGRRLGTDQDYVSRVENGHSDVHATRLVEIAHALAADPSGLLEGTLDALP